MAVTTTSGSPAAAPPTGGAAARADGANFVQRTLTGVGDAASAVTGAAGRGVDAVASAEPSGWWDRFTGAISSFSQSGGVGRTLGGILGLGGAWFAGNFFGGGIMSTILTVALAIPMMLVGSDSIGGWINGLLGNSGAPAAPAAGTTPSPAPAPALAQSASAQPAPAQTNALAASTAGLTLTNEELVAMVAPADNQRDRVAIFVDPTDATRRLQVRSVADSVADGPGIITLAALRNTVGSQTSGIVFGQAVNGAVSVQAAPMGALPNSSTGRNLG